MRARLDGASHGERAREGDAVRQRVALGWWVGLVALLACLPSDVRAGAPRYPGAQRVVAASGRWYVAIEARSDRWAFVERAPDATPLPGLHDAGHGRHGLPGPDPVAAGDRVLARGRLGQYPDGLLVAPDGSGFAAIASGYDAERRIREFVSWVPVNGPRVVLAALEPTPTPGVMGPTGPSWRLERFSRHIERIALQGRDGTILVIRMADGDRVHYPAEPGAALVVEYSDAEAPRLEAAVEGLRRQSQDTWRGRIGDSSVAGYVQVAAALLLFEADGHPAARQALRSAVRGDPALQLTSEERAGIITRAFDLLGEEAGPLLLPVLAERERNVRSAATWILGKHRDVGLPLARATLADPAQPVAIRVACAWMLAEHLAPDETQPLLAAAADPDTHVAVAAAAALGDRRWAAGPEQLTLLQASGPYDEQVARFFTGYVIPGAAPALVAALRRTAPGDTLRPLYVEALEIQTLLRGIGEDPDAWARALREHNLR